jgi:hypothetical protein
MTQYSDLLRTLGLPTPLISCAEGLIRPPGLFLEAPAEWYVFPPALIPIWSDGSSPSYIGYWKHWFLDRAPVFVDMYVEANCMVIEIARTPEQLFCALAIDSMCVRDGIDEELRGFAREVGITNLAELDAVTNDTGDDPKGFSRIQTFQTSTPLASITDLAAYTGDFPTGDFSGKRAWWADCCSCELPEGCLSRWPRDIEMPDWLKSEHDKRGLFEGYLGQGDLASAWLTLNSSGWLIRDARLALASLRDAARDIRFDLLVSAWLTMAGVDVGGY